MMEWMDLQLTLRLSGNYQPNQMGGEPRGDGDDDDNGVGCLYIHRSRIIQLVIRLEGHGQWVAGRAKMEKIKKKKMNEGGNQYCK